MLPWAWKSKKLQWKCWPRKTNRQDYCWTLSANLCINHLFDHLGWSFKKCHLWVAIHSTATRLSTVGWYQSDCTADTIGDWPEVQPHSCIHTDHDKLTEKPNISFSRNWVTLICPQGPTTKSKPASIITLLVFLTYLNSILKFGCTQASFISFCLSGK